MGEDLRHFAALLIEVYKWLGKSLKKWIECFIPSTGIYYASIFFCIRSSLRCWKDTKTNKTEIQDAEFIV